MSQDSESIDRFVTLREMLSVIEPYHNAVAALGSCMINASIALRVSDSDEIRSEGDAIFGKLESVISELEKVSETLRALTTSRGVADE